MLQKMAAAIAILVFIYGFITYGSWFLASKSNWYDESGKNGCLKIKFSVPTVTANTVSPLNELGRITTEIYDGYPVLFYISNAQFKIPAFNQRGHLTIKLGFKEITIQAYYIT